MRVASELPTLWVRTRAWLLRSHEHDDVARASLKAGTGRGWEDGTISTILIAEDDPAGRKLLVILLGYAGHRVLQARDGAEALALAREEHPDLVITDSLMPVMDGYDFVRQLRADCDFAATPVLFYTAAYNEQEARFLTKYGALNVLRKPTEPEQLLHIVSVLLNEPRPAGSVPVDSEQ